MIYLTVELSEISAHFLYYARNKCADSLNCVIINLVGNKLMILVLKVKQD